MRAALAAPSAVKDSPADLPKGPPPTPVPLLSAADEIKAIKLPQGFHMELVAAEPMVEHPVAMSFDADGRAWVVEMRSYMPDVEGHGEKSPTGRISILQDTDGDGRMDKAIVFLDKLVLPRAVLPVRGGALVAIPPKLIFCRDTDGDGRCDQQIVIATDYGVGGNPEHQPNGLLPALDNWIYSANYDKRLRFIAGAWIADVVPELGQWGISQDNFGRLYHDSNTDQLRASLIPPSYAHRNPHFRATGPAEAGNGANVQIASDQTVWPAHNTAVDRGYLDTIMRPDGTLRKFTAACAPCVYRGGVFPKEFDGNVFVCEPAANLIKRNILDESPDGSIKARNAYDRSEFVTSTYERFRPVNLTVGPDGALYVVDMHHGLLQHQVYLTTYCKDQYLARNLQKYMETGRIFRIVPDGARLFGSPHFSEVGLPQLVDSLSHPNGWWRDTAQRLIVERDDYHAVPLLRRVATTNANPLARLHALWSLEGMRVTDVNVIKAALADADPKIRAAAIRIAEPLLLNPDARPKILQAVMKLADDSHADVQLQFALTMSAVGTPEADAAVAELLLSRDGAGARPLVRDAVLTGLRGREMDFLKRLLTTPSPSADAPRAPDALLSALARCVVLESNAKHVAPLLQTIAAAPPSVRLALLDGFAPPTAPARRRFAPPRRKDVLLDAEPKEFLALQASADAKLKPRLATALEMIHWVGQPGYVPPPPPPPLSAEQQARFERGRQVYSITCIACHKANGFGQEGLAPPLVDSEWVLGPPGRIIRIVLGGLHGPVAVGDSQYSLDMPALGALGDEDVAAVLTYVRRSWDHGASPVEPNQVRKVRPTTRPIPWTERELLRVNE